MMARKQNRLLRKMSEANLTVENPDVDPRGRKVLDRAGEEIGEIDDLMIDGEDEKVRYLHVASGGFVGIGEHTFLIPVDAITRVETDQIHIDQTRDRVADAPKYDPALVEDDYYDQLYGYYGYAPYWGAGYAYPTFLAYP